MAKVTEFAQQSFIEDLLHPGPVTETKTLSIGETLKQARKRRGLRSMDKIAREICARPHHIQAIEEDRFDVFPAATYAMGFIRAYATYLGLDAGHLVRRYRQEIAAEQQTPKLVFLEGLDGPHMPKWMMAATILVLFAGSYAAWLGLNSENSPPLRAGVLAAEASIPVAGVKYAAKTPAAQGNVPQVSQPAQLQPTPVARAVKALPRGQKAVDAAPAMPVTGDSLAQLDVPLNKKRVARFIPASDDSSALHANLLTLTSGNAAAPDLGPKSMKTGFAGPDEAAPAEASFDMDPLIHQ